MKHVLETGKYRYERTNKKDKVALLPASTSVVIYESIKTRTIIYVGKAQILKNRCPILFSW